MTTHVYEGMLKIDRHDGHHYAINSGSEWAGPTDALDEYEGKRIRVTVTVQDLDAPTTPSVDGIEAALADALLPVVHPQTVNPEPGQVVSWDQSHIVYAKAIAPRVAGMVAEAAAVTEETSDGFHTFNELYRFRMVYNAALFNHWAVHDPYGPDHHDVHKSWRHHDGEECFGGGWFIVMATLPTGQISNHYPAEDWNRFKIPERDRADEWDGHTAADVAARLDAFLALP